MSKPSCYQSDCGYLLLPASKLVRKDGQAMERAKPQKSSLPFFTLRWWYPDWRLLLAPLLSLGLYIVWLRAAESGRYPPFLLPHPDTVWLRLEQLWHDGSLTRHTWVTLSEALYGLLIASAIALSLGYLIAHLRTVSYILMPYLIFIQAVPIVAISPLIIIWVGPDIRSKIVIAALITWFPLMIATMVGIRNVSPHLREVMRANAANPFQVFWHLELPSALPEILGGFKVAVTLAVIGAAVGEFVSSREGLGNLVLKGRAISDMPLVICAVLLLTLLSVSLYSVVALVEQHVLRWKRIGAKS